MLSHPSFDRLADLADKRLSFDEQIRTQDHVADCQQCADTLASIRRAIGLMRDYDAVDAPPHVIDKLLPLLRQHRSPARGMDDEVGQPSLRQRILAALRFDSLQQPAPALRAGQPTTRQMLFEAGQYDVDVRIAPSANAWTVSGQVLGPHTGGQIKLRGPAIAMQTELSALNRFRLPQIPAGRYTLSLHLDAAEVEIVDLEVGS
jgi:hypothetical protein